MKSDFKNFIYISVAGFLWGTVSIFTRFMAAHGSSTYYTSFLRVFFGFLILFVITCFKEGIRAFIVDGKTLLACFLLGLFTQAFYNIAYCTSINMIGTSMGAVLLYTAPIFTTIMSVFLFKEKMNRAKYLALFVDVIGCALTVTGGHLSGFSFGVMGVLIGISAGFFYSLAAIFGRLTSGGASSWVVTTYNFFFAMIVLGIFLHPWTTVKTPLSKDLLLAGFSYAIIPTALAYLVYFTGVQRIKETSLVPIAASIEVVSAAAIGFFLFKERLEIGNYLGMILVLASIVIMNVKKEKQ